MVTSSTASRLRAYGFGVSLNATDGRDIAHWYLNPPGDVRSSYALEVTANGTRRRGSNWISSVLVTRLESPDTARWVLCGLIASSIIVPVAAFGCHHCNSEPFFVASRFPSRAVCTWHRGPLRNQSQRPSQTRGLFKNRSNLANSCSSAHGNGSRHGFRIWKSRGFASVLDSATTSTIAWMNPSMPGA